MKLRETLVLALGGLFIAYAIVSHVVERNLVLSEFSRIEAALARQDIDRGREAISRELDYLAVKARDWATWDDTYAFISDQNEGYRGSNLKDESFQVSDFHLLQLVASDGTVIWHGCRDTDYVTPVHVSRFPADRLPTDHEVVRAEGSWQGVLLTEHGPLMVAAAPILKSDNTGPSRGWVVMGRFLLDEQIKRLRDQTRVDLRVHRLDADDLPARIVAAQARLTSPDAVVQEPESSDWLLAYEYAPQAAGKVMIEARIPRDIAREGAATLRLTMISFGCAATLACVLLMVLLHVIVVGPLGRLALRAAEIGRTGDLTKRIGLDRKDEIGTLAREFDGMVDNLRAMRAKLVETSRQAGMSEIAASVLHNVGNVLNSLNVSTATLTEEVQRSKVGGLSRVADLLDAHRDDLAGFIANDQRGRNLPSYLRELSRTLLGEQRAYLRELSDLRSSVAHVNEVVRSHEGFAHMGSYEEPCSLRHVVEQAIGIVDPSFERHGIEVQRDLVDVPTARLDGVKCTQVLVNLLSNARDAVASNPEGRKRVAVRLEMTGQGDAVIEVSDNGIGISSENLHRIFASGFTTKARGRGLGLHYCALAAREMGGEITAGSPGPGAGASFRLRVPLPSLMPEAVG